MNESVWKIRSALSATRKRLKEGRLTIGFMGGSITCPIPRCNWPEPVTAWFVEHFPQARICVENASIGATGSDFAVFRAQRDIIDRNCDLVFVEYSVNDGDEPSEKRMRTREGLLRKLLRGEGREIVIVHTYRQSMYEAMSCGEMPDSIEEFERLAEHYGISSVWMGLYAFEEIKRGRMRWDEWLPTDNLHPTNRGSLSYAQSVTAFLEKELLAQPCDAANKRAASLPEALNVQNWENVTEIDLSTVQLSGPWSLRRSHQLVAMDRFLFTSAVGARLSFPFEGRGLCLAFDFGKDSSEFRYRFDKGEWKDMVRDRQPWCPATGGWYRPCVIGEDLDPGEHAFELEVTHGNVEGALGTNFYLGKIGVIR